MQSININFHKVKISLCLSQNTTYHHDIYFRWFETTIKIKKTSFLLNPDSSQNRLKHCVYGGFLFVFQQKVYDLKMCILTLFGSLSIVGVNPKKRLFFYSPNTYCKKRQCSKECCRFFCFGKTSLFLI